MQILITLLFSLIGAVCVFTLITLVVDYFYASKRYLGDISDHFDGKHFYNIDWSPRKSMRLELWWEKKWWLIYWLLHREKRKWEKREITPVKPPERNKKGVRITNIWHATYLIQVDEINILTDPVWGNRASPWSWIGPKRYQDPGVSFEDLPHIDIVLLSHNHYDHMEISTLRKLHERDDVHIYTGLGNKDYLETRGIKNIVEMDWWQLETRNSKLETRHESVSDESRVTNLESRITFLPAQHFSARGVTDRNRTLWWAFCIEIGGKTLYFWGDTGYGKGFIEKTRERFPDGIDIGLIPIGAYKPRWFMAPVHTDPFEGMQMQRDLWIKRAIGIHHSTFDLADDNQDDPVDDLREAQKRAEYIWQIFEIGDAGTVWNY
jgi:L-ascorbate metabolism protein UlaG (beta-lactamase superfamily)